MFGFGRRNGGSDRGENMVLRFDLVNVALAAAVVMLVIRASLLST